MTSFEDRITWSFGPSVIWPFSLIDVMQILLISLLIGIFRQDAIIWTFWYIVLQDERVYRIALSLYYIGGIILFLYWNELSASFQNLLAWEFDSHFDYAGACWLFSHTNFAKFASWKYAGTIPHFLTNKEIKEPCFIDVEEKSFYFCSVHLKWIFTQHR